LEVDGVVSAPKGFTGDVEGVCREGEAEKSDENKEQIGLVHMARQLKDKAAKR
jgi:hypothetical protein